MPDLWAVQSHIKELPDTWLVQTNRACTGWGSWESNYPWPALSREMPSCFAAPTPKAQTFSAVCLVLPSVDAANWPKVWP